MDFLQVLSGLAVFAAMIVLPGYFLTLAFFPKKDAFQEFERVAISFVFSITFLPLIVLVENQVFSIKIEFFSSVITMVSIILFGFIVWKSRTRKMKKSESAQIWFPKTGNKKED